MMPQGAVAAAVRRLVDRETKHDRRLAKSLFAAAIFTSFAFVVRLV